MDTKDTKGKLLILTFVPLVFFVLNSTRDTKIRNGGALRRQSDFPHQALEPRIGTNFVPTWVALEPDEPV